MKDIAFFISVYLYIYLIAWWTVLFAMLPLGVTSHREAGVEVVAGGDPGSPVDPKLKKKFLTTSWIAAVITVLASIVIQFHLIKAPQPPGF